MNDLILQLWLAIGLVCIITELFIPGLVVIFVGLGALTVASGIYLGYVNNITTQLSTFFISSLIYLLTLRMIFIHYFPTNAQKENIDEDENVFGQVALVVELIPAHGVGRIQHSDSTWPARSHSDFEIAKGAKVKIIGRENITWIVEK